MQLAPTYKNILALSFPLILFNVAQNAIGFTDTIFLGRVGVVEQAAVVPFSIFYLVLIMVGYGLSRGAQIIIARRVGEGNYGRVGKIMDHLFLIEILLGVVIFLILQFALPYVMPWFVQQPEILEAGLSYLSYRSYGVFFTLLGFALLALYTGIGNTKVIIVVTFILGTVNIFLDYCLIFGNWGFPEMGIAGAGLASAIAEFVAGVFAVIYIATDRYLKKFDLFKIKKVDAELSKKMFRVSFPLIVQYIIGLGGWFLFFTFIENMGETVLAASGILKWMYTFFTIPAWGMSMAINSLVSNQMGQKANRDAVLSIKRTVILSVSCTAILCIFLAIFPETFAHIFTQEREVIETLLPVVWMLIFIMITNAYSTIVFNGVIGTGATDYSLRIEMTAVALYVSYAFFIVNYTAASITTVWLAEFFYWFFIFVGSMYYFFSSRWKRQLM